MHDLVHTLERLGLPTGLGLIAASTWSEWIAGHVPTLNQAAVVVGMACTVTSCVIRVADYRDRRRAR